MLRTSGTRTTEATWTSATVITDTWPGSADAMTAVVSYQSGTIYFALKTRNAAGWSALSNNAFWPHVDVYLPLTFRD